MRGLPPIIRQLDKKLEGLPDQTLTALLIALGLFAFFVAAKGTPTVKAALVAWFVAP